MRWLLIGYMYLFIHRPFEIWTALGAMRLELLFAGGTGLFWLAYPGKRWLPNPLHRAYGAFAVAALVCWGLSPWMEDGVAVIDKYFKQTFFYILFVTVIHDEDGLKQVIQAFLVVMAIYMLHSFNEFRCGRYVFRMGIPRMIGVDSTLNDPNAFAANLTFAVALVPAGWVSSRSPRWRAFLVCYFLLTSGCVALTGSRGGFVAMLLWLTIAIWRSRFRWAFALTALLAAPFIWAALPKSLQTRFETIVNPDAGPRNAKESADGRLKMLQLGVELFNNSPLTGVGPGAWRPASKSPLEAHNLYGQVMGEMGLLGILPFLAVVLLYWVNTRRIAQAYKEHPHWERDFLFHLGQGLSATLVLLLLTGNFSHHLFRYTWLWYGAFLIVTRQCVEQRRQADAEAEPEEETEWEPEEEGRPAWAGAALHS